MKIYKILLKKKVEILLMVILIVSAVVFILNTKESVSEETQKETIEHPHIIELDEFEDELGDAFYSKFNNISMEVFLKYFTGEIGTEISFADTITHKYQDMAPDKNANGEVIYTKTRIRVNGIDFKDEVFGETLEEGWIFCLIDITVFNDYPEERILYYYGSIAEWDYENNKLNSIHGIYKLLPDEGVIMYNPIDDDGVYRFLPFDEGYGFSVEPGESITYKAVIKVPTDYMHNNNLIFYQKLDGKAQTNCDFGIRLFPEE